MTIRILEFSNDWISQYNAQAPNLRNSYSGNFAKAPVKPFEAADIRVNC